MTAYNTLSSFTSWDTRENALEYDPSKPLFTDASGGDYTLSSGSQAIDRGNNAYAVYPDGSAIETDLAGNARIINDVVDLGAYEYNNTLERPATIVTTLEDKIDSADGVISLREAIEYAGTEGLGNVITFAAALAGGTITLSGTQLEIAKSLTIDAGALANGVTINADQKSRVFHIDNGTDASIAVALTALTITGGDTSSYSSDKYGGGIYNKGTLTLTGCTISGNSATSGGGIYNDSGTLTLTGCTVSGNSAGNQGGGINNNEGTLTLTNCTISDNSAPYGGGIFSYGSNCVLTLTSCTISGNLAASGGGIYKTDYSSVLTLTNCTISGNSGGGIRNRGTLTLTSCTISGNSAGSQGGGIYNYYGTLTLTNTIVAMNYAGYSHNDIYGSVSETSGNNMIGYKPLFVVAPVFDADGILANAATLDLRLTSKSRAINAGLMVDDLPEFDLDGNVRVYGGAVDIGAYEFQGTPATKPTVYSTVVNTLNDSFDLNDGEWSLREALYWATGPGTITFTESIAGGTILLNDRLDFYGMNIDGGELGITLDAQKKSRVMSTSGDVTLHGLTITGGETDRSGGGINNSGTLTLTGCTISGNSASGDNASGGGICNSGTLTLTNCTISGNSISGSTASTSHRGGGICNNSSGTLTLYNSIVAMNTSTSSGNDVYSSGGTINAFNVLSSYTDWTTSESCYVYDSARPLFTDAENGDYTLCENSQAIDLGNNSYAVYPDGSAIETDLAGNARIINGVVDLGAFEYQGASILPLATPASVAVVSGGANRQTVSWDAVENALGYTVLYSTDQVAWRAILTMDVSSVVSGLSYGATVYYRVKALGDGVSCDDSDWSAVVSLVVCPMDVNGDGRINAGDRNFLSESWNMRTGSAGCDPRSDVNGDGRVNAGDRNWLSSNWGKQTAAADLTYPEALAAATVPASAAMDAVFDDAFESAWEEDEFEFFG